MKKKDVNQSVCFDNNFKEIASNFLESKKMIQQYSTLYTISFIKDFHCRNEHNKAENNNNSSIALILRTIFVDLTYMKVFQLKDFFSPYFGCL